MQTKTKALVSIVKQRNITQSRKQLNQYNIMSLAEKGHRTLPQTLDYLANNKPNQLYALVPHSSTDVRQGFRNVTVEEMCHSVDSLAHWLADTFGTSDNFETLSYIGVNDLRYPMFMLAAIKCGYKTLCISPRNPPEQNMSLLLQAHCRRVFFATEMQHVVDELTHIETIPLAPWELWLDSYSESYPWTKKFEDCKDEPIAVMHSSGSTGKPKIIVWTHAFLAADDMPLPSIPGRNFVANGIIFIKDDLKYVSCWPFFHIAGVLTHTTFPLYGKEATFVMLPPQQPVTADLIKDMLKISKAKWLAGTPALVETMVRDPEALPLLKELDTLLYGGGPLAPAIGNKLAEAGVGITNTWGQTESALPCMLQPKDLKNWEWLEWHPCVGIEFEPVADGKYELVMNPDPEKERYRAAFQIMKDRTKQMRSKDLFTPHPTEPGLWKFFARTDDVIVFSTGRKWFPLPSEGRIMAHPKVRGAMISGNGRPYPIALVEGEDLTIDELWPTIEDANIHTQEAGRLTKSQIAILPTGSLARSPKDSIVRMKTLERNAEVIESLYVE